MLPYSLTPVFTYALTYLLAYSLTRSLTHSSLTGIVEAVELLRATGVRQALTLGSEHPRTLRSHVSLAEALLCMDACNHTTDHAEEAKDLLSQSESAQRVVLDSRHPLLVKTRALVTKIRGNNSRTSNSA